MGKAYTEEEKQMIREKIWEEGLALFHAENQKELNIREITKRVGISLGSFYRFYPDKEALINDIMKYRCNQKLDVLRGRFSESLQDPEGYLFQIIYDNFEDMAQKIHEKAIYAEAFSRNTDINTERFHSVLEAITLYFVDLGQFWREHACKVELNADGIVNLIVGITGVYSMEKRMDPLYFKEIVSMMIKEGIRNYCC